MFGRPVCWCLQVPFVARVLFPRHYRGRAWLDLDLPGSSSRSLIVDRLSIQHVPGSIPTSPRSLGHTDRVFPAASKPGISCLLSRVSCIVGEAGLSQHARLVFSEVCGETPPPRRLESRPGRGEGRRATSRTKPNCKVSPREDTIYDSHAGSEPSERLSTHDHGYRTGHTKLLAACMANPAMG